MMDLPKCPFGREVIDAHIPHRPPMAFLDRVIHVEANRITAESDLDPEADFFKGHFPGNPIMPGVLMAETAAQAGALLVSVSHGLPDGQFLAFSGLDNVKIRKPVFPIDRLRTEVEIVKARRSIYKFGGELFVGDTLVMSLSFTAALMKFSKGLA